MEIGAFRRGNALFLGKTGVAAADQHLAAMCRLGFERRTALVNAPTDSGQLRAQTEWSPSLPPLVGPQCVKPTFCHRAAKVKKEPGVTFPRLASCAATTAIHERVVPNENRVS